jgi:hypothetical protein
MPPRLSNTFEAPRAFPCAAGRLATVCDLSEVAFETGRHDLQLRSRREERAMVSMTVTGPRLSEEDVEEIEKRSGLALPDSYRSFLLEHNGGVPTPDTIDIEGAPSRATDVQVRDQSRGVRRGRAPTVQDDFWG